MNKEFLLFDMDGVLLRPGGYQQALQASITRIGKALGAPATVITSGQIAHFEALSVTNEWDTLAICTALILLEVWQVDSKIRLEAPITQKKSAILPKKPDFQKFLESFHEVGPLPGLSAFDKIKYDNPGLDPDQMRHLWEILSNCRDIYHSLTLPMHQETVLGSPSFQANYNILPQLNTESYLLKYDRPLISVEQVASLIAWLEDHHHHAGVLTNRPNATPQGYVSAPEAELGVRLVGLQGIPVLGSGILNWFAETQCGLHPHVFLKPHPVHTLALCQMCLGHSAVEALRMAVNLSQGITDRDSWLPLNSAKVTIFEDSVKGLQSGLAAQAKLEEIEIPIELTLIGVSDNPTKITALAGIADDIVASLDHQHWL